MRSGVLPGGDEVCHGYHVWNGDECIRCGFIDSADRGDITNEKAKN